MQNLIANSRTKLSEILTNSLARNTGWMVAGLGGNFLLQAGSFLLLARLLGVTEYGVFAGAFALVSFVTPYCSLGTQMVFMRHTSADPATAQAYWGNMVAVTAVATLALAPTLALAGRHLFGPGTAALIEVLVFANCLMGQVVSNASLAFQTFEDIKAAAWLRLLSNLFRLVVVGLLLLSLHRASPFQCSLALLVSSTVAAVIALVWVRSDIGPMHVSGRLFRLRFWEGIGFSVAGSTTALYNDVDKIMLSHYGMNAANGIYTMAYRVADFATTPVNAIDAACVPRYFALNNQGLPAVTRMARKMVPIAALCGVAAACVTLLASPFIVHIVGHGFGDALVALRWLCWLPPLRALHQLAGAALTATGRQNYRTASQFAAAGLNLILNLAWIPSHGWRGAAWSSLISDGALGAMNLVLVFLLLEGASSHRKFDPHRKEVL